MPSYSLNFDTIFKPRPWQAECIAAQTKFTVLALHRRAGKTTLALAELLLYALKKPGCYAYLCPQKNQAVRNSWMPLKEYINAMMRDFRARYRSSFNPVTIHESDKRVDFFNGSQIILLGADDPDNIRGIKLAGCVLDEVAQMPPETWGEVVMPALSDSKGWALFIGTPKGQNLFSELYQRGFDEKYRPEWSAHSYTVYDTGVYTDAEIEAFRRDMPPEAFRREWLCDFSAEAQDQLISGALVDEAMSRTYDEGAFAGFKLVMGVDVGRYGPDRSVIFMRRGKVCYEPFSFHGLDLVSLGEQVVHIAREHGADIINVDGTGMGGGVVDVIRRYGYDVNDINFGQRSAEPGCANKRTELWNNAKEWLKSGGALPKIPELKAELTAPTYEKDDSGMMILESKKAIRKRLGLSPDMADAFCLLFCSWQDETPAPKEKLRRAPVRAARSTPFERFENQIYRTKGAFGRSLGGQLAGGWRSGRF